MKHIHHIVPKHMGGTDDPSNLVELTIEEHAEAHRILYEEHGKIQDKLAWMGLSKMIDGKEIISTILKQPKSDQHREKISKALKGRDAPWAVGNTNARVLKGRPKSDEHKKNIAKAHQGMDKSWLLGNRNAVAPNGRSKTSEHQLAINIAVNTIEAKQKKTETWNNKKIVECPHCGLKGKEGHNMKRYHFDSCKSIKDFDHGSR